MRSTKKTPLKRGFFVQQALAKQFAQARYRDGREYLDQRPKNAVQMPASLSFPYNGAHEDGPIFMAQVMEEKWDMFLLGNRLYVARSWTGKLAMVATCQFFADRFEISNIEVDNEYVAGQSNYPAQLLDFLIKSDLSRWQVAHPIPQSWLGKTTE